MVIPRQMMGRHCIFLLFMGFSILMFFAPLKLLVLSSLDNELYSHIILIPLVSIYLVYTRRREIFFTSNLTVIPGSALVLSAICLFIVAKRKGGYLGRNDFLSLVTLASVICWLGGFVFFYGLDASRQALFPLLFLFFMVPVPDFLMERIILLLQICSAEVSFGFFKLTGVPIFREGFIFHLSGLSVEVAKQCGGIRSSLALFITSVLAGHLFLRTGWGKLFLAVAVFPITIFKNSVRIVFLSLYGAYVDPGILSSVAHRRGGIPFFFGALALLGVFLVFIRQLERRSESGGGLLEFGKGKV